MTSFENTMDPKLWSNLQYHISLHDVFLKGNCQALYRLRGVCKEWNSIGKQQLGFSDGFQSPYFVIVYPISVSCKPYHVGILSLHIASGQWRWKPLDIDLDKISNKLSPLYVPFSMNGSLFLGGDCTVYDIHTKETYEPQNLSVSMDEGEAQRPRVVAMAVDTSVTPSQNKMILAGPITDTHIFCRKEPRQSKPSRTCAITSKRWTSYCLKSCLQLNDHVYIWWQMTMIQVYSLKEDKWTAIKTPRNSGDVGGALVAWNNRLFVVMKDESQQQLPSVCVWELVDESKQVWRQFSRMPREMYTWVVPADTYANDGPTHVYAQSYNSFVLMYTLLEKRTVDLVGISDNFVMLNLESKKWEKLSLWDKLIGDTNCPFEDTRCLRYEKEEDQEAFGLNGDSSTIEAMRA